MDDKRLCAWWFFGAMLLVPTIDRLFTLFGYSLVVMFTGPLPGVAGGALHVAGPTALALGLAIVFGLAWFVVARRGAPRLLWLVPLAFTVLRFADLAVNYGVRWYMTRGSDFAPASEWLQQELASWPYTSQPVYLAALIGYPVVAWLGTWLGGRSASRAVPEQ